MLFSPNKTPPCEILHLQTPAGGIVKIFNLLSDNDSNKDTSCNSVRILTVICTMNTSAPGFRIFLQKLTSKKKKISDSQFFTAHTSSLLCGSIAFIYHCTRLTTALDALAVLLSSACTPVQMHENSTSGGWFCRLFFISFPARERRSQMALY